MDHKPESMSSTSRKNRTLTLLSADGHLLYMKQIPSLGAVVFDLFSTFLQRLHENVHISVGLDPNQFLRQVDLKLNIWDQRKQRGVLFHSWNQLAETAAARMAALSVFLCLVWPNKPLQEGPLSYKCVVVVMPQPRLKPGWTKTEVKTLMTKPNTSKTRKHTSIRWHAGWLITRSQKVTGWLWCKLPLHI